MDKVIKVVQNLIVMKTLGRTEMLLDLVLVPLEPKRLQIDLKIKLVRGRTDYNKGGLATMFKLKG